jgi:hypothetical protein
MQVMGTGSGLRENFVSHSILGVNAISALLDLFFETLINLEMDLKN